MNDSKESGFWDFLSKYMEDINLSNSFLILGVGIILITFYCKTCRCTSSDIQSYYFALKIGFITLFFGGMFRFLNIIMKPLRDIKNYDEHLKDLLSWLKDSEKEDHPFFSTRIELLKSLKIKNENKILKSLDSIDISYKIFRWNDFLRYSVWSSFLIFYILIIIDILNFYLIQKEIFISYMIVIVIFPFYITEILYKKQVKKEKEEIKKILS